MKLKNKMDPCIQVELADYCFDQEEVHVSNPNDNEDINDILNAPDDADLTEIRNLVLVDELISRKVEK